MDSVKVRASGGFTLLEILVALTLIGLLIGAMVPTVLNQLGGGEASRVASDIRSVENAAKTFRIDVNRWPGDIEDLTTAISSTDNDFDVEPYPPGLMNRWDGPYIEGVVIADDGELATAAGGQIQDDFATNTLNSQTYLTIAVEDLTSTVIAAVSQMIDGNEVVTDDDAGGRVREEPTGTLQYLAAPIQ